jgi:L-amino acid N-acyltransferase YncA/predicted N-acetyltransferase YhbS
MDIVIERAHPHDLPDLRALLEVSRLPADGLSEHIATTIVARDNGQAVGCAALELYGAAALLRSVAVIPALRGRRLGERLVRGALDLARQHGIATVYLLTETAIEFYPRFGFQPIQRAEVAPAVQQSVEFTSACPSSAQAMKLVLASRARGATLDDADDIARIYNQGIEDRVGTFETRPRSAEDVRSWFDGLHPIVVVEDTGEVIAFASTSTYRPRDCYAGIAEFSVYVARERRGRGAGRLAMLALIDAADAAGLWKLVSRVFFENAPSRALLRTLGFREVGVYEKHGQLDGVWRDVVIVERLIEANLAR